MNPGWSRRTPMGVRLLFAFLCVGFLNLFGPLPRSAWASAGCLAAQNGVSFTYSQDWAQIVIGQPLSAGEQFTVTFDSYSNDNGNGPAVKEMYLGQGDAWANANINSFAHFTLSGPVRSALSRSHPAASRNSPWLCAAAKAR